MLKYALAFGLLVLSGCQAGSPWGLVSTVAGERRGIADGEGRAARFDNPTGLAVAADGTIYVADTHNHRIRAIDPARHVTTLAGGGPAGAPGGGDRDGPGAEARFRFPRDLALDGAGHLYVADTNNHRVRAIDLRDPAHHVTTIAGSVLGLRDGPGAAARFFDPWGLAAGPNGILYVSDTYNHRIRRIDTHATGNPVSTLAGTGPTGSLGGGYLDGPGAKAYFKAPRGVVADGDDVYVADAANQAIRRISAGVVSTMGGTRTIVSSLAETVPLIYPTGLVMAHGAAGNHTLYAVDSGVATVYRVTGDGVRTWLVGGATMGNADGFWRGGQFRQPAGIACDPAGNLLVTDTGNHRIRLVM
ncbi:MAG: hypothetical protein JWM80_3929 [Cyanobacteria bacterium RYN_339]|nr:hypothetical protein [Cyanobacteria bacterium RYN_339]